MGESREKSQGATLGYRRWHRYVGAFDRVQHCIERGYYLEAVAILDSLITDRLTSRVGYLSGAEPRIEPIGPLCRALIGRSDARDGAGLEHDDEFREVVEEIRTWAVERNHAIHATAKILRSDDPVVSFDDALRVHHRTALRGVALLQRFDRLDTSARQRNGTIPASAPNAFFPERRRIPSGEFTA
ncbi:hypothetical protein [Nocardia cyriacigeorgica]|uniref:hypothetical protein n=1 Tax=Nocardia cyriacigeorgica TaxID=135487 RepID=UPI0013D27A08|nr:hypothetical protein [Nocardia cyriacigeorgica]NEW27797.1 hypothetical protein [Nocardia cyriacigeorgica]